LGILLKMQFCAEAPGKIWILTTLPSHRRWARRRRWPAGLDQQAARDSLGAHLRSIGGVGRRGWDSGEGARQWPAVVDATAAVPASRGSMPGNGRRCKPLRVLRRRFGQVESSGWRRRGVSPSDRQWRTQWSGRNGGGLAYAWGEWATLNRARALSCDDPMMAEMRP
jgi:hypothetical protein